MRMTCSLIVRLSTDTIENRTCRDAEDTSEVISAEVLSSRKARARTMTWADVTMSFGMRITGGLHAHEGAAAITAANVIVDRILRMRVQGYQFQYGILPTSWKWRTRGHDRQRVCPLPCSVMRRTSRPEPVICRPNCRHVVRPFPEHCP